MLSQAYPQDSLHNVCIMGLHTCGDLSGTALRLFTKSSLQCLVQVGCCYHLLEEEFIRSPFWKDVDQSLYEHGYGFPLSEHLRSRKFFLGRNVRMSGTQSPERVIDLKQTFRQWTEKARDLGLTDFQTVDGKSSRPRSDRLSDIRRKKLET
ncbi:methyltransferase-like protein 25 [Diaphorina citri]|uniref:Methyltransferase-like protein 25 n=1 Tax=Diaphorina citri TaxID=121845 RepID=A0A1S3DDD9_DIACI|nr:methyltransferase-like protein 25 [Diaphorina citri]